MVPLGYSDEGGLVNEAADDPRGAIVEPGRALALADFTPPAIGTGERLVRLAYRIGVPGSALTSPFRKPAKPRKPFGILRLPARCSPKFCITGSGSCQPTRKSVISRAPRLCWSKQLSTSGQRR